MCRLRSATVDAIKPSCGRPEQRPPLVWRRQARAEASRRCQRGHAPGAEIADRHPSEKQQLGHGKQRAYPIRVVDHCPFQRTPPPSVHPDLGGDGVDRCGVSVPVRPPVQRPAPRPRRSRRGRGRAGRKGSAAPRPRQTHRARWTTGSARRSRGRRSPAAATGPTARRPARTTNR